ncbi:MAG: hypothetical protein F6K56_02815, partial [Moorea sp. SIO3G5]|nr:hypothetical protein [Moorena sp. SIO3G5]
MKIKLWFTLIVRKILSLGDFDQPKTIIHIKQRCSCGAAGFFGAITCATTHPHTNVTLLEASRQPLSK